MAADASVRSMKINIETITIEKPGIKKMLFDTACAEKDKKSLWLTQNFVFLFAYNHGSQSLTELGKAVKLKIQS